MKDIIFIGCCVGEHFGVGLESDPCSRDIGIADYGHRLNNCASCKFHAMNFAVLVNLNLKPFRKSINNRSANAVKTSGNLVSSAAELAACVKNGENYFKSAFAGLLLNVNGNASAVIRNADYIALFDINLNVGAVSCKSLIDRVINNFINKVMQTRRAC